MAEVCFHLEKEKEEPRVYRQRRRWKVSKLFGVEASKRKLFRTLPSFSPTQQHQRHTQLGRVNFYIFSLWVYTSVMRKTSTARNSRIMTTWKEVVVKHLLRIGLSKRNLTLRNITRLFLTKKRQAEALRHFEVIFLNNCPKQNDCFHYG